MIVRGVSQWHRNNNSPRLTVEATVVAKRIDVSHHHHGGETHHMTTSTRYYVTFQVESGDRMEFSVSGREYGLLVEGDTGRLTFQGTRYLASHSRDAENQTAAPMGSSCLSHCGGRSGPARTRRKLPRATISSSCRFIPSFSSQ